MKAKIALLISVVFIVCGYFMLVRPLMKWGSAEEEYGRNLAYGARKELKGLYFFGPITKKVIYSRLDEKNKYHIRFKVASISEGFNLGTSLVPWYSYGFNEGTSISDSTMEIMVPKSIFSNTHESDTISKQAKSNYIYINQKAFPYLSIKEDEVIVPN